MKSVEDHERLYFSPFRKQDMSAFAAQPNPSEELLAGLTASLRRWSALRAAVSDQWGGPSSHAKAEALRMALHSQLTSAKGVPEAVDIEDYLLIYMEEEYSCQLEDDSEKDLAGILAEMAAGCSKGDFNLARQMVQFAEVERATLEGNQIKLQVEGELDDEGDDMMDDEEGAPMAFNAGSTATTTTTMAVMPAPVSASQYASGSLFADPNAPVVNVNAPPPRQLGEAAPVKESMKVVDEDGFECVAPRRSGRKNKGQLTPQPGEMPM
jgi:pre-rRNA-processing protein TSR2